MHCLPLPLFLRCRNTLTFLAYCLVNFCRPMMIIEWIWINNAQKSGALFLVNSRLQVFSPEEYVRHFSTLDLFLVWHIALPIFLMSTLTITSLHTIPFLIGAFRPCDPDQSSVGNRSVHTRPAVCPPSPWLVAIRPRPRPHHWSLWVCQAGGSFICRNHLFLHLPPYLLGELTTLILHF